MDKGPGAFKDSHFGDEKVRLSWRIRRSTEDKFRRFVARKHGFCAKGLLGYELDQAMNWHMRKYFRGKTSSGQKDVALSHPINTDMSDLQRAVQLRDKMVKYFIDSGKYEEPPTKVPLYMLKWAICAVTGVSDDRALKRRLILLQSTGLIKQVDWVSKEYAIIYGQYSDSSPTTTTKEDLR